MQNRGLTVGQVFLLFVVMSVGTYIGASVALPGLIAESARRFRDPRESTPDWMKRRALETSSGTITYRFMDRGVMIYSHADPLCDEPQKFVYKGLRYYSNDTDPRDGYPYGNGGGPVARTITWRVLGKIQGVNVVDFGAYESIEDPWMVFVGISPGYENRSMQVLEEVAQVITAVQLEKRSDLEYALSKEDEVRAKAKEAAIRKKQEERRKQSEAERSQ